MCIRDRGSAGSCLTQPAQISGFLFTALLGAALATGISLIWFHTGWFYTGGSSDFSQLRSIALTLSLIHISRSLHAQLIQKLNQAGAKVIAFDILFSEPSEPNEDQELARALRQADNVVLVSALSVVNDCLLYTSRCV